ncbi:MAG: T9SS type A sorting domain-containing protein [Candidatus Cloacimonetes bacterium]|nr:T9SS type A sorting domain-containing protein [Candidatus Cloacimonadota bacterium]
MKRKLTCTAILLFFLLSFLSAQVNGQLSQIEGKNILHVWGTHSERGYALGYLMGNNLMNVFSNYFFPAVSGSNAYYYNNLLQAYTQNFVIPERYVNEAQGVINGMQDAGISTYHNGLARNLTVDDILFVNGIVDIAGASRTGLELGCSSLSSWGASTMGDPSLQGALSITRMLDWNRNQSLIANPVLVVHHPSEANERKWMSFTYPGLFGALSAIAEDNAAAFLNMGNIHAATNLANLTPVLLDIRSGLELLDYNSDGLHSTEDVFASVMDGHHMSGTIIHNTQQWQDSCRATIIETNNSGTVRRLMGENSDIAGDNLAATNHFRALTAPVNCYRYSNIIDSLAFNPYVGEDRQWMLLKGAAAVTNNMMMIQYLPTLNKVLWSNATATLAAYTQTPLELDTTALFDNPVSNSDEYLSPATLSLISYPNPLRSGQSLSFKASPSITNMKVYNLRGQLIHQVSNTSSSSISIPSNIFAKQASGIYFIKATERNGTITQAKLLYLK